MRVKFVLFTLAAIIVVYAHVAEAQQAGKVPRIGFLSGSPPSSITARTEAFRQGLRDLGYVEGKNILIGGDLERENAIVSPRSRRT